MAAVFGTAVIEHCFGLIAALVFLVNGAVSIASSVSSVVAAIVSLFGAAAPYAPACAEHAQVVASSVWHCAASVAAGISIVAAGMHSLTVYLGPKTFIVFGFSFFFAHYYSNISGVVRSVASTPFCQRVIARCASMRENKKQKSSFPVL
jgi:hypothetical protein